MIMTFGEIIQILKYLQGEKRNEKNHVIVDVIITFCWNIRV